MGFESKLKLLPHIFHPSSLNVSSIQPWDLSRLSEDGNALIRIAGEFLVRGEKQRSKCNCHQLIQMCIITSTSAMMHRHTAARCVSSENHCPPHNDGARSKLDWKLSEEILLNVELYAFAGCSSNGVP